jgi:hypothetical protein
LTGQFWLSVTCREEAKARSGGWRTIDRLIEAFGLNAAIEIDAHPNGHAQSGDDRGNRSEDDSCEHGEIPRGGPVQG